jgi:hypothetical protein
VADGVADQIIYLECEDGTKTVQFEDGTGLQLAGGTAFTLGLGDILVLKYHAALDIWREVSRSDN